MSSFDVIVIGAGISGSSTAYALTSRGHKCLLLEQFHFLHHNGSSHGRTRIFRLTYAVQIYSMMCQKAFKLWKKLEEKSQMKVFYQNGGLDFGPKESQALQDTIEVCRKLMIPHIVMEAEELTKKYPQFKFQPDDIGLFQENAGFLNATEGCRMFQWLAACGGCQLKEEEKVIDIVKISRAEGRLQGYLVKTTKGEYNCKKLVICCGSWIEKFLKPLKISIPVEIWKCCYSFYRFDNPPLFQPDRFPIWIYFPVQGEKSKEWNFYGFPSFEYPDKIKGSIHYSEDIIDPDHNNHKPSEKLLEAGRNFMSNTFVGVSKDKDNSLDMLLDRAQTCLYTVTPDENFILDYLPGHDGNIAVFGGCSGHAFKFGPLLGEILADLIEGKSPEFDLSIFSINRFSDETKNSLAKGPMMLRDVKK